MSKSTRRDFLTGTVGGAVAVAVAVLPSAPIAGLTSVTTLASLAAEGKYASIIHTIPEDVNVANFEFSLNGEPLPKGTYCEEIYAPGDESGWAVVFNRTEPHDGSTHLVHGNWKMWRET